MCETDYKRNEQNDQLFFTSEEMAKWKKMTGGMAVLSVAVTALVLATEEHHHVDEDAPVVSTVTQRSNAYLEGNAPFPPPPRTDFFQARSISPPQRTTQC